MPGKDKSETLLLGEDESAEGHLMASLKKKYSPHYDASSTEGDEA